MTASLYPRWWRKHFLRAELGVAIVVTALLIVWCRWNGGANVLNNIVRGSGGTIDGTLASIFGSLLGFTVASLSVILAMSSSEQTKRLRQSACDQQLWAVFSSAIKALGLATITWLMALFFDREVKAHPLVLVLCLGVSFLACLRTARCVWVLERVVEDLVK